MNETLYLYHTTLTLLIHALSRWLNNKVMVGLLCDYEIE